MTEPPNKSRTRIARRWALAIGALVATALLLLFWTEITAWASAAISTFTSADEFRDWVEGFGAWGPLVFLGAQAIQVIVAPVPGAVFPPVGSLAFGPWPALVLSLAGMAIGSAVVFLAARRWGRPLALRLAGKENVDKYEGLIEARGNILLWLVFLLPLLPDDAVCALAGISRIPFRRFMLIAVVGRVPAVAAGVFAMAGLERAPGWVWVVASLLALLLMWAGTKVRRGIEQRIISENRELRDEVSAADGGD